MIALYRFKIAGKPSDPLMLEQIGSFPNRSEARRQMNQKRHSDVDYKYAIYEGKTFLSSTF